jgi:hypothetical protein
MEFLKEKIDWLFEPTRYFLGFTFLIFAVLKWRKIFSRPIFILGFFVFGTAFLLWALGDPNFLKIVGKPDNVPIVILLATVVFFSWLALRQAVINDARTKEGVPTLEGQLSRNKVFTWPDLVYTEFICLILFTAVLVVWSILLPAPIEEAAELSRTPNPSKAPWYFLGLQELLVYFDPWIAGVLLPGFIIVGLCAIPYLDTNPKGNGYYTFDERPFAVSFFWVGFILFWVSFVILGTFLRGPNWSFFGPFEYWNVHKLEPMVNVDLSTYFWVNLLDRPLPNAILLREAPGILLLLGYFLALPGAMAKTLLRGLYAQLGPARFHVFFHFALWFGLVPIKMLARWVFNLKYFVAIPEFFFNV